MKIYSQPTDGPDAWVHEGLLADTRYPPSESKTSMDAFDTLLRDLPTPSSTLAELKPLDPLDYLTASPDTSGSVRQDPSPTSSSSPNNSYRGAITNNNTFLGYSGTPEPVSTTTSPLSSSTSIQLVKQEPPSYSIPQDIDDIASIIGSAISENPLNTSLMGAMVLSDMPDSLDPLNSSDLDIEAWIESMSSVKAEPMDSLIHSSMSPSSLSPNINSTTSVPQASTTTHQITTTNCEYDHNSSHLQHQNSHQIPTSSPMLQSLLAAGTVTNNNYLHGLVSDANYQKQDISMPILQARLTQGLKDIGSGGGNGGLLKADTVFNRASYYTNKDSMPHSTDPTAYTVTTTDDFLITKYDSRSYLDKTQLGSPESTDLSSTKLGLDFTDLKGKNRNRMNKSTKLSIRTEGTKDKPVHHCTVCNRGFLNKSNIKVHLRTHTGEKPFKCETCNKAFRQKAHLLKHYQIHRRDSADSFKSCESISIY
ncbi:UNVERIFIED_CONTAM: hypothetical protein RMT77_003243 [Armadillidium vulgare]